MDVIDKTASLVNRSHSWINNLKPAARNKLLEKKFRNLNNKNSLIEMNDLSKFLGGEYKNEDLDFEDDEDEKNKSVLSMKWEGYLKQSKQEKELDFIDQSIVANSKDNEISMISENFEEINCIIEEKYKISVRENIFLRGEYHSIMPFLMISSKEIHRMVISDYEVKEIIHNFIKKSKRKGLEYFDYYRMGLITFYKGNYIGAYNNFKIAHKIATGGHTGENLVNSVNIENQNSISNLCKWLAFSALIILFCPKLIDFSNLRNVIITNDYKSNENEYDLFLFSCCSTRKNQNQNSNKLNKIGNNSNSIYTERDYELVLGNLSDSYTSKLDLNQLAQEIEDLLPKVKENQQNSVEGWWLQMYVAIYCNIHKDSKIFSKFLENPYEAKYCIKIIKEIDGYLSYIAYAEMNNIFSLEKDNYRVDKILFELIFNYQNKFEAFFKYWQILVKKESRFKNYKKAHTVSEIFWRRSSTLKFDEDEKSVYYLYVMFLHAKSSYLIGNTVFTISIYQKEFTANFLYPSIYYLFGKFASKSGSKNLKTTAISSLIEVNRLLNEDLQYMCYYWLGNLYNNIGQYDLCYKIWKKYLNNSDRSFNLSQKKLNRIMNFIKQYQLLCDK